MVSLIPADLRRKKHHTWNLTKSLVILATIVFVYLVYSTPKHEQNVSPYLGTQSFDELYLPYRILQSNGTDPSNNTDDDDDDGCNIRKQEWYSRCAYIQNTTACSENVYVKLQWCEFLNIQWLFYILAIFYILLLFYMLGNTAEAYFSPALIKMSDYLRLSPNVAGVTLLALGNGAPDLSTIIIGVFKGSAEIGFGAPIGGGVFVTTFVFGIVTLAADVKVTRRPYLRDVGFYLISVGYSFYLFMDNKARIYESIILLILYVIYVVVVIVGRIINQALKRRRLRKEAAKIAEEKEIMKSTRNLRKPSIYQTDLQESLLDNDQSEIINSENIEQELISDAKQIETDLDSISDDDEAEQWIGWTKQHKFFVPGNEIPSVFGALAATKQVKEERSEKLLTRGATQYYIPKVGVVQRGEEKPTLMIKGYFDQENSVEDEEPQEIVEDNRWFMKVYDKWCDLTDWRERKWYEKISFFVIEWYTALVRNLTIPKADETEWNRWFTVLIPIFAPVLVLLATGYITYMIGGVFPMAVLLMLIGVLFSIVILVTTSNSKPPIYQPLLVLIAFGMSIVWIYLIATQLVNVLSALGEAWGIDKAVLAVTVLSWGNSLGDMISDVVVARQGYPSMAVGAIFGGPMLNLLLGLGIAITFSRFIPKVVPGLCFAVKPDGVVSVSFIFLLVSLIMSLIVVPVCKFRSRKVYGVFLILFYVLYLVMSLLASLQPDVKRAFTWKVGRGC